MASRALVVGAVLSGATVWPLSAGADCSGPTIEYTAGIVDRGDPITVVGRAWGDNCYDTGPPPSDQGVLGVPVEGVTISVVQGDLEVVVAQGSAEADYSFQVTFAVPDALQPGGARVVATAGDHLVFDATNKALEITDRVIAVAPSVVVEFGPGPTTTAVRAREVASTTTNGAAVASTPTTALSATGPLSPPSNVADGENGGGGGLTGVQLALMLGAVACVLVAGAALLRRRSPRDPQQAGGPPGPAND